MANLLSRKPRPEDFPILDPQQLERFETRLRTTLAWSAPAEAAERLEARLAPFEEMLEELESEASLAVAFELLEEIDGLRRADAAGGPADVAPSSTRSQGNGEAGELICYRAGRSLSTGEPNVASRGFFDLMDRPPIGLWLEAIARRKTASAAEFELAILAWVPARDLDRAKAGCRACTSHSLAWLDEVSPDLARQLGPIVSRAPALSAPGRASS